MGRGHEYRRGRGAVEVTVHERERNLLANQANRSRNGEKSTKNRKFHRLVVCPYDKQHASLLLASIELAKRKHWFFRVFSRPDRHVRISCEPGVHYRANIHVYNPNHLN
jgi:hypothetical protein